MKIRVLLLNAIAQITLGSLLLCNSQIQLSCHYIYYCYNLKVFMYLIDSFVNDTNVKMKFAQLSG